MTKKVIDMTPAEYDAHRRSARRWAANRAANLTPEQREAKSAAWFRWWAKNRDRANERHRAYSKVNQEKVREGNRRWLAAHPEYVRASARRKYWRKQATHPERLYGFVAALVPPGVPRHNRDDAIMDVVMEILEGHVRKKDAATAMRKALSRLYPDRKMISLDAVMPGTESLRYHDILAAD